MSIPDKHAVWKWPVLALLIGLAAYVTWPIGEKVRLGIDIKGGASYSLMIDTNTIIDRIVRGNPEITPEVLTAQVNKEVEDAKGRALEVIRNRIDSLGIEEPVIYAEKGNNRIVVQLPLKKEKRDAVKRAVETMNKSLSTLGLDSGSVNVVGTRIVAVLPLSADAKDESRAEALDAVRKGFADAEIKVLDVSVDGNRMVVQLAGQVEDADAIARRERAEAEAAILKVAFLEFRLVHEKNETLTDNLFEKNLAPPGYRITAVESGKFYERDFAAVSLERMDQSMRDEVRRFHAPLGYDLLLDKVVLKNKEYFRPMFVERNNRDTLTGDLLENAEAKRDNQSGQPIVSVEFNKEGTTKFRNLTKNYCRRGLKNPRQEGRNLAIVLDGTLYSAPELREAIPNGQAVISGRFSWSEALQLARALKAGALPAPVLVEESMEIDPTLGRDAVDSGIRAALYGCVAILVLMAGYYLFAGLVANITMILNVVLLPLGMLFVAGLLGAFSPEARAGQTLALPVLTLPGIAGIALSIGMAVDANVLIFERMREEFRLGKNFGAVVNAGFDRAFSAIFDSNLTTIITAVFLFYFGSGPVRGYAVTLAGGLIISLFTAVVVSRMCFNLTSRFTEDMKIFRMFSVVKTTAIDFMGVWKIPLTISVLIILGTWAMLVNNYRQSEAKVMGIDFIGGTSLTLGFDEKQDVGTIRSALESAGVRDPIIQYQKTADKTTGQDLDILQVKVTTTNEGAIARNTLTNGFAQARFHVRAENNVGPNVSKGLQTRALKAMIYSIIAMVIYISLRFKFGFALGAVAALFHDVLITAGLVHILGFQMNMTVLAGLMTIVGYSVNDTIVIFDRIRENLRLVRGKTFSEICNQSMNETLARTLLTNFLTFVSVAFLLFMGGASLKDFAVTMFIGMIAGTYSTIYIATPVVLFWYRFKRPDLGVKTTRAAAAR